MPNSKAAVLHGEIKNVFQQLALEYLYPVGSLYISLNSTNPGSKIGGTWELIQDDTFIASKGSVTSAGNIGGKNDATIINHTHPASASGYTNYENGSFQAMSHQSDGGHTGFVQYTYESSGPSGTLANSGRYTLNHRHTIGSDTTITVSNPTGGQSVTNKNMPKYLACYIWKRIA